MYIAATFAAEMGLRNDHEARANDNELIKAESQNDHKNTKLNVIQPMDTTQSSCCKAQTDQGANTKRADRDNCKDNKCKWRPCKPCPIKKKKPTLKPTRSPSIQPTIAPSIHPTELPSLAPTLSPSPLGTGSCITAAPGGSGNGVCITSFTANATIIDVGTPVLLTCSFNTDILTTPWFAAINDINKPITDSSFASRIAYVLSGTEVSVIFTSNVQSVVTFTCQLGSVNLDQAYDAQSFQQVTLVK